MPRNRRRKRDAVVQSRLADDLGELKEALDKGLFSKDDYDEAKRRVVDSFVDVRGGAASTGGAVVSPQPAAVSQKPPRRPFAFDIDALGEDGLPVVKKARSTGRGGFEPQQAVAAAMLYGGFAEELIACCGPSDEAEAARRNNA